MFVNVARRDQVLLNRQLSFIDALERSEEDPKVLADLFRLDHLATRMRRNAESLLVLAGSDPPRTWPRPIEAAEIVRPSAQTGVEFAGWGQSADGHSIAQSEPSGAGLEVAIKNGLRDAHLESGAIDYVNAHATATKLGDAAEARALLRAFGSHRPPVSSTKGLTGHPLSMSGIMEAAFCTIALQEGFVPGNAHLEHPDPVCEDLVLPVDSFQSSLNTVLSTSSGFGGSNVALILRKH